MMKFYIVFEIIGTVSLTRNLDLDTNSSSKSGNLFDARENF